jgi:antitoxin component YwqK of YwqJK toxin-antitoxin module
MSMKKIPQITATFFAFIFLCFPFFSGAQETKCDCNEVKTNRNNRTDQHYYRKAETTPYTGYCFYTAYNSPKDTVTIVYYYNGVQKMHKYYQKGKLVGYYSRYYPFKNDSIVAETINFDETTGDTTLYEVEYLNAKKQKWKKTVGFYPHYQENKNKPLQIREIDYSCFFRRDTTKANWDSNNLEERKFYEADNRFDSLGYTIAWYPSGSHIEYFSSGSVAETGTYKDYKNVTAWSANNYSKVKTGTWKYYADLGKVSRIETYDEDGKLISNHSYYQSGKIVADIPAKKSSQGIILPPSDGIAINSNDTFFVDDSYLYENGLVVWETIHNKKGDKYYYGYYENGVPRYVNAWKNNKPIGIWKTWNTNGTISSFLNFSIPTNDTIAYVSYEDGKFKIVNLKEKTTVLNPDSIPANAYYQTWLDFPKYLMSIVSIHRQYFPNGKISEEIHLKNFKREGEFKKWYENGQMRSSVNYTNDMKDGHYQEWYQSGKIKYDFNYHNGIRTGDCIEYYENGIVKWKNNYEKGIPGTPVAHELSGASVQNNSLNKINAFSSYSELQKERKKYERTAITFYLSDPDRKSSDPPLIISDSTLARYEDICIAIHESDSLGGKWWDYSSDIMAYLDRNGDLRHSGFTLYSPSYSDNFVDNVKKTFTQNDIVLDSIIPVTQDERTWYQFYYSSKYVLNKIAIENFFVKDLKTNPENISFRDYNFPTRNSFEEGGNLSFQQEKGHLLVKLIVNNDCDTCSRTFMAFRYCIYNDLSCDFLEYSYSAEDSKYWIYNDAEVRGD